MWGALHLSNPYDKSAEAPPQNTPLPLSSAVLLWQQDGVELFYDAAAYLLNLIALRSRLEGTHSNKAPESAPCCKL
jgi:hypothetical protein